MSAAVCLFLQAPRCRSCDAPLLGPPYQRETLMDERRPMVEMWPSGPMMPDPSEPPPREATGYRWTLGCCNVPWETKLDEPGAEMLWRLVRHGHGARDG